jgi:hypothetical protein
LYDVYTHNGGVHVHRILIFIKYLIMTGSWTGGGIVTNSFLKSRKCYINNSIFSNNSRHLGQRIGFSDTRLKVENLEYLDKTTDLSQVTDKLYHIMLHQVHPTMIRIFGHNVNFDKKLFKWLKVDMSSKMSKPRYNWNIVESGVKHHKPKPKTMKIINCTLTHRI